MAKDPEACGLAILASFLNHWNIVEHTLVFKTRNRRNTLRFKAQRLHPKFYLFTRPMATMDIFQQRLAQHSGSVDFFAGNPTDLVRCGLLGDEG